MPPKENNNQPTELETLLEKQLNELIQQHESALVDLKASSETLAATRKELEIAMVQKNTLQSDLQAAQEENEALLEVNRELTLKVEELSSPKSFKEAAEKKTKVPELPKEPFEVDGVQYVFVSPVFVRNGQRIAAEEAIHDGALLAELVAKGSGVIKKA